MRPNKPTSVKLLPTAISKIDHKVVGNFEIFMKITLQDLCNGFESWTVKKAAAAAKLR